MQTKLLKEAEIYQAAEIIKSGGLVAFPTETVYGLGANALDSNAVDKIFVAKGRPQDNPLIVHLSSLGQLDAVVCDISHSVFVLAEKFCPGPLTMVLKKNKNIPLNVTAQLDTVAVRFPSNKTAQKLIEISGLPIAAPSANISGKPSPTSCEHVVTDMLGKIDAILDGGRCLYGIESTVVDLTQNIPVLLRPGSVTYCELKSVLPDIVMHSQQQHLSNSGCDTVDKVLPSPGMKYAHYAPNAKLVVVEGFNATAKINEFTAADKVKGLKTAVLAYNQTESLYIADYVLTAGDKSNPADIAHNIFHTFRQFNKTDADIIYVEGIPNSDQWMGVRNRIDKAANQIIKECQGDG